MRSEKRRSFTRESQEKPDSPTVSTTEFPILYAGTNIIVEEPRLAKPPFMVESARELKPTEPRQSGDLNLTNTINESQSVELIGTRPDWFFPAMMAGALVCSLALLAGFATVLMHISAWAARNPVASRVAITGIHAVAIGAALTAGVVAANEGDIVPVSVLGVGCAAAVAAILAYPATAFSLENFTSRFIRRKTCEMLLFAAGTSMVYTTANITTRAAQDTNTSHISEQLTQLTSNTQIQDAPSVERVKAKDPDPPRKKRMGLKILVIVLFVVATVGIGALSCSLSCAGHELAALLVLALGEGALIFGFVASLRALGGKKTTKRSRETQPVPAGGT